MLLFNQTIMKKLLAYKFTLVLLLTGTTLSCDKYLDLVPDNVATIEHAFQMRNTAERYLFTCYSFIPDYTNYNNSVLSAGDEWLWPSFPNNIPSWHVARGLQNTNAPLMNFWPTMYRALRECNIFLDNVERVPDLLPRERDSWIGEVKFLKAYYHFFLLTMYGPVPIVRENIPISATPEEVRVARQPVDEVVEYIVELLDEALLLLPEQVQNQNSELGRITLPIAAGLKAKVLVYAASPLFNGNSDYAGYTNKDGTPLFNTEYSLEKWEKAAEATKAAIELCHSLGYSLYEFQETNQARNLSEETKLKMNIRNMFTERWNSEVIWANTNTQSVTLQHLSTPAGLDPDALNNSIPVGTLGVPFRVTDLFYSKNGVPINEDLDWSYTNRFNLRVGSEAEKYFIKEGYTTAEYNFDREPRFYATFGFDGGIWYGNGKFNDNDSWYIRQKVGQTQGKRGAWVHPLSGYFTKKYVHYSNIMTVTGNVYTVQPYPWIMLRLGDLYLLHAEAMNEAYGPSDEVYEYLDRIRQRAGLKGVVESWSNHSRLPTKFTTQAGLREIIQQERGVETALEGSRFFDLRRWKSAVEVYNSPVTGWDVDQELEQSYYREKILFRQDFTLKNYFWPISEYDLIVNKNLVQTLGW